MQRGGAGFPDPARGWVSEDLANPGPRVSGVRLPGLTRVLGATASVLKNSGPSPKAGTMMLLAGRGGGGGRCRSGRTGPLPLGGAELVVVLQDRAGAAAGARSVAFGVG
jgi:hypothetical protein